MISRMLILGDSFRYRKASSQTCASSASTEGLVEQKQAILRVPIGPGRASNWAATARSSWRSAKSW